jgi:hypothetical protein
MVTEIEGEADSTTAEMSPSDLKRFFENNRVGKSESESAESEPSPDTENPVEETEEIPVEPEGSYESEDEQEYDSDVEDSDVETDEVEQEEDEVDPNVPQHLQKKINKRIGKLTARAKEAEEQVTQQAEKIAELEQQLENANPDQQPIQIGDNPLSKIKTLGELKEHKSKLTRWKKWLRENHDGFTANEDGEEREYSENDVRRMMSDIEYELEEHVPSREEYLKEEGNIRRAVEDVFPYWKDKSSPQYQQAMSIVREAPELRTRPNWQANVSIYLLGLNEYNRMLNEGKKKPSKAVKPTRTATRPKAQPQPVRNAGGARLEDAQKALIETGSRGSLTNWFAANRQNRK